MNVADDVLLAVRGVTVDFGGNRALTDVDLDVRAGTITGLIGPNGAGKTTLFNVVTGLLGPSAGTVHFGASDISRCTPHERARLGIARTFQRLELFTDLTVRDNVRVAGEIRRAWRPLRWRGSGRVTPDADAVLDRLGLGAIAGADVADISTGTARLVELARALMIQPRLLLLDEPASGQRDDETTAFAAMLRELVDADGLTVLLIEHDMSLVMGSCDHVHVLDHGETIASGSPAEVRGDAQVRTAYLGTAR